MPNTHRINVSFRCNFLLLSFPLPAHPFSLCLFRSVYVSDSPQNRDLSLQSILCLFFFSLILQHKHFSLAFNTFEYIVFNGCITFHYVEVHIKMYLFNLLLLNIQFAFMILPLQKYYGKHLLHNYIPSFANFFKINVQVLCFLIGFWRILFQGKHFFFLLFGFYLS